AAAAEGPRQDPNAAPPGQRRAPAERAAAVGGRGAQGRCEGGAAVDRRGDSRALRPRSGGGEGRARRGHARAEAAAQERGWEVNITRIHRVSGAPLGVSRGAPRNPQGSAHHACLCAAVLLLLALLPAPCAAQFKPPVVAPEAK